MVRHKYPLFLFLSSLFAYCFSELHRNNLSESEMYIWKRLLYMRMCKKHDSRTSACWKGVVPRCPSTLHRGVSKKLVSRITSVTTNRTVHIGSLTVTSPSSIGNAPGRGLQYRTVKKHKRIIPSQITESPKSSIKISFRIEDLIQNLQNRF